MPLEVTCPGCSSVARLPDNATGKMVRCGQCGLTFAMARPPSGLANGQALAEISEASSGNEPGTASIRGTGKSKQGGSDPRMIAGARTMPRRRRAGGTNDTEGKPTQQGLSPAMQIILTLGMFAVLIFGTRACGSGMSDKEQYWYDYGESWAERKLDGFRMEADDDATIKQQAELANCPSNYVKFFSNGYRKVVAKKNKEYEHWQKMHDNK